MKKYQRGITLSGLMTGGAILFVVALLGMKVSPAWIEYGKIKKAVASVAKRPDVAQGGIQQVNEAFDKQAELDQITSITHDDLEITKEGNDVVIAFAYTSKVKLMGNASLMFEFAGSSKGKDSGG
jgi:hypothetical protein